MSKFLKIFAVILLLAGCSDEKKENKAAEAAGYNLIVSTQNGDVRYMVENAVTPAELSKGLMFRDSLDADSGMIFDFTPLPKPSMWMRNTKIPLDMVFTDGDGKIVWIFENAVPMSEELITPPVPVKSVVEFNSGDVKKHNMKVGDTVLHEFFNNITYEETDMPAEPDNAEEGETEVDASIVDDGSEETIVKE